MKYVGPLRRKIKARTIFNVTPSYLISPDSPQSKETPYYYFYYTLLVDGPLWVGDDGVSGVELVGGRCWGP